MITEICMSGLPLENGMPFRNKGDFEGDFGRKTRRK